MYHRFRLLFMIAVFALFLVSCGSTPEVVDEETDTEYVEDEAALEEEIVVEEPTPTVVPTPTVAAPTLSEGPTKDVYASGDVARVNAFLVRVDDIKITKQTEMGTAKEGNTFVLVDITLENTSSEQQSVSALLHMSVQDGAGQDYALDVDAGVGFLSVNGPIDPGTTETATIGYQVPENAEGLHWIFRTTEEDASQGLKESGKAMFEIDL
jgi:hypothetical protein